MRRSWQDVRLICLSVSGEKHRDLSRTSTLNAHLSSLSPRTETALLAQTPILFLLPV